MKKKKSPAKKRARSCKDPEYRSIIKKLRKNEKELEAANKEITNSYKLLAENESILRESELMARAIFDQTYQFIGLMNLDGTLIDANRAALEFAGIKAEDVINKPFWLTPWWIHSKEVQKKLRDAIEKAAAGEFVRFETTHKAKDGSLHYIDFSLKPVRDAFEKVIYLIPEGRDITERKGYEEELKRNREKLEEIVKTRTRELEASEIRFRRLFESAKDGILILDAATGAVVEANPFFLDIVGYSHNDIVGKKLWDLGFLVDRTAAVTAFKKLQKDGYVRYEDLPLESIDGNRMEVEFISNVYEAGGKKVIQCNIRDITARKNAEAAVLQAYKAKSAFTSMVSHELRTPLTVLKESISQMLEEIHGPVNEKQKAHLKIQQKSVDRLARLINQVLDFQALRSGKMQFSMGSNDINETVEEACSMMASSAKEKGLFIDVKKGSDIPSINFDRDKILEVILNLLSNAIKLTEGGGITVTTSFEVDHVKVSLRDTGPGIKTEDMGRLFHQFEQLERRVGGTGLGLAICKDIVEAHGGRIWAESKAGHGATFSFELPLSKGR